MILDQCHDSAFARSVHSTSFEAETRAIMCGGLSLDALDRQLGGALLSALRYRGSSGACSSGSGVCSCFGAWPSASGWSAKSAASSDPEHHRSVRRIRSPRHHPGGDTSAGTREVFRRVWESPHPCPLHRGTMVSGRQCFGPGPQGKEAHGEVAMLGIRPQPADRPAYIRLLSLGCNPPGPAWTPCLPKRRAKRDLE